MFIKIFIRLNCNLKKPTHSAGYMLVYLNSSSFLD
jgi:hypothetical protein